MRLSEKIIKENGIDASWIGILEKALSCMAPEYSLFLTNCADWLPGEHQFLRAFSVSLSNVRYVLLGESPYPRQQSANGYAFWDNAVGRLWSEAGLSKPVNRATSFRNLIKMLLVARGDLTRPYSQDKIASLSKSLYCKTAPQFFEGLLAKGFLLLNASLVYSEGEVRKHAKYWKPFINSVLCQLLAIKPDVQLILLGKIANEIPAFEQQAGLVAEHPYNVSFIDNKAVIEFFNPLDLLAQ